MIQQWLHQDGNKRERETDTHTEIQTVFFHHTTIRCHMCTMLSIEMALKTNTLDPISYLELQFTAWMTSLKKNLD
jgi:Pyruvate/2-oxoacid:ferredoxin oxidoreductase delta subunit